jgi:hypothetical protein
MADEEGKHTLQKCPLIWIAIFNCYPNIYEKPLNWIAITNRDPIIYKIGPTYLSKTP